MRILVTGGAGFIGSHVVALLKERGVDTCVYDSLVSGKIERIPEGVLFIQGDIRDKNTLATAMRDITHVVHLAAQVGVPASIEDPDYTHEVNVTGTRNVFKAAREAGVKRVVYASSAAVYGDYPELPKTEESPLQPKSPYAESKIANEIDASTSGLPTVGLRFFNVYGPGQEANHPYASVIPRWVAAVEEGRPVELHGDGTQTRDFIHVQDVARAIVLALESTYVGVCNIASGIETTLREVLEHLAEVLSKDIPHEEKQIRPGDIKRSVSSIDHARRAINFTPEISFKQGLENLVL